MPPWTFLNIYCIEQIIFYVPSHLLTLFVQSMLIKSFCLSLYGGQLWNLCNTHLKIVF